MDFGSELGFRGGNTGARSVPEVAGGCGGGFDNLTSGVDDQAIWATEDEYRTWNPGPPGEALANFNHNSGRSGSEPPNKKSRSSPGGDSASSGSRSTAIGRMFFKTKLCSKFRAGVCPYVTNCNFAHGTEELRKPPPNWQEIVAAAHAEERGISLEQREEHQIPTVSSSDSRGESQRSYKGRHCKKFYTEEGCPFGENCTFLHDEQSRARESVAISVSPTIGGSGYGVVGTNQKPSNWKTRICNKWETTGNCPFGSNCHFAHGLAELHKYGGRLVDTEGREPSTLPETKPSGVAVKTNETIVTAPVLAPSRADFHHAVPSQRPSGMIPPPGQRHIQKWKGPDKISRIYGDWIDDME